MFTKLIKNCVPYVSLYSNLFYVTMPMAISSKVLNVACSVEQNDVIIQVIKISFFSTLHCSSCISMFVRTSWTRRFIVKVQFTELFKGLQKKKSASLPVSVRSLSLAFLLLWLLFKVEVYSMKFYYYLRNYCTFNPQT